MNVSIWFLLIDLGIPPFLAEILTRVLNFFMIIIAAAIINRIFGTIMRRIAERGGGITTLQLAAIGSGAIWMIAILYALHGIGLQMDILLLILGLGIFAMVLASRDVLANWVGGYVVSAYRLFKLGDWISVGKYYGRVARTDPLDTTIVTPENKRIIIPNATFIKKTVVNLTAPEGICVTIPFEADRRLALERVEKAILEIGREMKDQVLEGTEPEVMATRLGDRFVEMKLILHIGNPARVEAVRSEAIKRIKEKLETLSESIPP
ncbi:MAG: mechanosensitive ion channel family protein [Candidatus Bathyarchaeia archaeon]